MSIIGGKLKLKGSGKNLDRYKKKVADEPEVPEDEKIDFNETLQEPQLVEYTPENGTGRIITSSTTIHGKDTKFQVQLNNGDFLIVMNPNTLQKEERELAVVLSDKSASLKAPFSSDIVSFSQFEFRKKPELKVQDQSLGEEYKERLDSMSKKIKKPDQDAVLEYREKTGMWGYKTIKQKMDKEMTREQLLDMRTKKSRDKFCWF